MTQGQTRPRAVPSYDTVSVGDELPAQQFPVRREHLIRYAGACGDFNVIHWNERVATSVGLPNVVAHGMFTMASAGRVVTDWVGDPGAVVEFAVRFARPVVVPDDDVGATIEVSGKVVEKLNGNLVRVMLTVTSAGQSVLAKPYAVVRLR